MNQKEPLLLALQLMVERGRDKSLFQLTLLQLLLKKLLMKMSFFYLDSL